MSREPFTEVELDAIEDLANRRGYFTMDEYARLLIADFRAARAEVAKERGISSHLAMEAGSGLRGGRDSLGPPRGRHPECDLMAFAASRDGRADLGQIAARIRALATDTEPGGES